MEAVTIRFVLYRNNTNKEFEMPAVKCNSS